MIFHFSIRRFFYNKDFTLFFFYVLLYFLRRIFFLRKYIAKSSDKKETISVTISSFFSFFFTRDRTIVGFISNGELIEFIYLKKFRI